MFEMMKAPTPIREEIRLPDGRTITLETGRMARQADGSVLVTCGGTALLATVVSDPNARPGVDFMPLTVEYKEKFASSGRVPGGFLKREMRPADREILVARLVGKRRSLLDHLKATEIQRYRAIIEKLGLRK